jgi:RNA polymerase sigma-70 factor (ECF subfamily)
VPSFDQVFTEHVALVWRALRRLGVAASDIEDVSQEVFTIISRRLPAFEGRSALSSWIYGICVNVARTHRRTEGRRREDPTDTLPETGVAPLQLDQLEQRHAFAVADAMLDALDDEKRAVFVLYEIEEIPMKEVAEALGCPLQTAYTRLYAARRDFEAAVQRARLQGRIT